MRTHQNQTVKQSIDLWTPAIRRLGAAITLAFALTAMMEAPAHAQQRAEHGMNCLEIGRDPHNEGFASNKCSNMGIVYRYACLDSMSSGREVLLPNRCRVTNECHTAIFNKCANERLRRGGMRDPWDIRFAACAFYGNHPTAPREIEVLADDGASPLIIDRSLPEYEQRYTCVATGDEAAFGGPQKGPGVYLDPPSMKQWVKSKETVEYFLENFNPTTDSTFSGQIFESTWTYRRSELVRSLALPLEIESILLGSQDSVTASYEVRRLIRDAQGQYLP